MAHDAGLTFRAVEDYLKSMDSLDLLQYAPSYRDLKWRNRSTLVGAPSDALVLSRQANAGVEILACLERTDAISDTIIYFLRPPRTQVMKPVNGNVVGKTAKKQLAFPFDTVSGVSRTQRRKLKNLVIFYFLQARKINCYLCSDVNEICRRLAGALREIKPCQAGDDTNDEKEEQHEVDEGRELRSKTSSIQKNAQEDAITEKAEHQRRIKRLKSLLECEISDDILEILPKRGEMRFDRSIGCSPESRRLLLGKTMKNAAPIYAFVERDDREVHLIVERGPIVHNDVEPNFVISQDLVHPFSMFTSHVFQSDRNHEGLASMIQYCFLVEGIVSEETLLAPKAQFLKIFSRTLSRLDSVSQDGAAERILPTTINDQTRFSEIKKDRFHDSSDEEDDEIKEIEETSDEMSDDDLATSPFGLDEVMNLAFSRIKVSPETGTTKPIMQDSAIDLEDQIQTFLRNNSPQSTSESVSSDSSRKRKQSVEKRPDSTIRVGLQRDLFFNQSIGRSYKLVEGYDKQLNALYAKIEEITDLKKAELARIARFNEARVENEAEWR